MKATKTLKQAQIARIRDEIDRVFQERIESANSTPQRKQARNEDHTEDSAMESPQPVVRRGRFFDASLARRRSSRGKRRYDSGLEFLEEALEEAADGNIDMEAGGN